MKVLHLFDSYLPSTLSWTGRLLARLAEQVEIGVAAPWIVQGPFHDPRFRYFTFPLQRWAYPAVTSEWQHPVAQRYLTRSQRFWPTYPRWLAGQLRSDPPDLLHAHFGPTGCLYLPLAQRLARPLLVTFYGFDYEKLLRRRPMFRQKYRTLFAQASRVIAASPTGCRALEALGCPAEKLVVVRPAPELARFPWLARRKQAGRLSLVQVATFTAKKGHLTTLEAMRLALPDCPQLQLTLAGEKLDQALVDQIKTFIRHHRLENHIEWLDFVAHDRMAAFLGGFEACIHPSQTGADGDHEATPVALLEAQATGLPVLATTHFDLPDEVIHEQTGLLAPEGDAPALAAAIRRFYHMDDPEYQQFSQRARQHIEDHFTVEKSAAALLTLYHQVLQP